MLYTIKMEVHTLSLSLSLHLRSSHITTDYFSTTKQKYIHNLGEREQTAGTLNKSGVKRKQKWRAGSYKMNMTISIHIEKEKVSTQKFLEISAFIHFVCFDLQRACSLLGSHLVFQKNWSTSPKSCFKLEKTFLLESSVNPIFDQLTFFSYT